MDTITRRLELVVATALDDAIAFHGDLGLPAEAWKSRIAAILDKSRQRPTEAAAALFAERLHTRDLYLATCCAAPLDSAWRRFETLYQKYVEELVRYLSRS